MMKQQTRVDYAKRIRRVTDYIHDHLDEPLEHDKLAEIACLSPYHWHRIYVAMCGETVTKTIKRLKLHRAAGQLFATSKSILEIARSAGFSSSEAFSRAFKQAYEVSPQHYRDQQKQAQLPQHFIPKADNMYPVEIRNEAQRNLAGLHHTGSYMEIGKVFERLVPTFIAQGKQNHLGPMGALYFDDPAEKKPEDLRSFAGVFVGDDFELDAPLEMQTLPAGKRAVLIHKGPYHELTKAYQWFFGPWLQENGHELAPHPPMEAYMNNPQDTAPKDLITEIHMALA